MLLPILYHYIRALAGPGVRGRAALRAWQDERVRRHLRRVVPRSRFYARHYAGERLDEWRALPLVEKGTLMAEFDAWNTVGVRRDEAMAAALRGEESRDFAPTVRGITVGLSSGTSGKRALFLASAAERQAWAGTILAKLLPAPIWVAQRIAFFLRANSTLYQSVASRHLRFEYYDLLAPLEAHVERLNRLQPTILIAPPAMLRLLADAPALHIAPRRVISVADVLDPQDERRIAQRFEQPVHQVYQATEGLLGASCRLGTLHLAEDVVAVQGEPVDVATGRIMPILTDFRRTSQPILRYRLDDVLALRRDPCACGSPFLALARIEGRCDDLFWLPDGRDGALRPIFPDALRRAMMIAAPEVATYRVRQLDRDRVEVALLAPPADAERAVRAALDRLWAAVGVAPPTLAFVPAEPPDPARKERRVERLWQGIEGGAP